MKKIVLILAVGVVMMVVMASCHKDEDNNNNTNTTPQDTTQTTTQKHNVELVFENGQYQNIAMDTIRKYNADETVDTIFMVPRYYNDFSTAQTPSLQGLVNRLRDRHNVNPDKVFGKGELQLDSDATLDHPEIVRFFEDTLRYHVTYYGQAK